MRTRRTARSIAMLGALAALASRGEVAGAHAMAPALFEIEELGGGRAAIAWKISLVQPVDGTLEPVLPSDCIREAPPAESLGPESITTRWTVRCPAEGLVGREVGVEGLAAGKTDALVRVELADGRVVQGVLRAGEPRLTIPARPGRLDVLWGYGKLGVEHILTGPDHLLFVLGLLLLVVGPALLVKTITAFTVGHSITLSIAAFGIASVPSRPIEVAIAASVFVLAVELTREAGPVPTLLRRLPWLMAGSFGLLHGLGFAGALAEVGLPAGEIPLALFAFNGGIELGQLAFVATALAAGRTLRRLLAPLPAWVTVAPVYAMGTLSVLWCLERTAALLSRP